MRMDILCDGYRPGHGPEFGDCQQGNRRVPRLAKRLARGHPCRFPLSYWYWNWKDFIRITDICTGGIEGLC